MRIKAAVDKGGKYPITVREGREWLGEYIRGHKLFETVPNDYDEVEMEVSAELKNVWFRYEPQLDDTARGLSLKAYKGELLAIVGGNGTGKTTALSLICGLNKPYRGKVLINGERIEKVEGLYDGVLGVLPQDPRMLFVKKTVRADLEEMLSGVNESEKSKRAESAARLCGISELLERHPYDLSGGEQQRAALAKVLLKDPEILILDEPTKGMDSGFKNTFAAILKNLTAHGKTVIMVSHDIEFCAEYADRCAMLFDGEITSVGRPREFFSENTLYTTAARRIARGYIENAVTAEDIIYACTGEVPERKETKIDDGGYYNKEEKETKKKSLDGLKKYLFGEKESRNDKTKGTGKRNKTAALMILLVIPLTVFVGIYYLGDRKYYFISLLVILEAMLPFAMMYEKRKPKPRELVTVAVLCAMIVVGRAAFFWIPQFKPVAALVIISGAAMGAETGFLVGAMSAFVSNFFFGQGPWTPWQMFTFGILGFLAGLLFYRGILSRGRLPISVFGGLAVLLIYGGLMNPASLVMSQSVINSASLRAVYISGLPFDMIHSAATVVFLWLAAPPMLEKLDRIKEKYGLCRE